MDPIISIERKSPVVIKGGINCLAPFRDGVLVADTRSRLYYVKPTSTVAVAESVKHVSSVVPLGATGRLLIWQGWRYSVYDFDNDKILHTGEFPVVVDWAFATPSGSHLLVIADRGKALWRFDASKHTFDAKITVPSVVEAAASKEFLVFVDSEGNINQVALEQRQPQPHVIGKVGGTVRSMSCNLAGSTFAIADDGRITYVNKTDDGFVLANGFESPRVNTIMPLDKDRILVSKRGGGIDLVSSTSQVAVQEDRPLHCWVHAGERVFYGTSSGDIGEIDLETCQVTAYGTNDMINAVNKTKGTRTVFGVNARGKATEVALAAVARKSLVLANVLLRDNVPSQ